MSGWRLLLIPLVVLLLLAVPALPAQPEAAGAAVARDHGALFGAQAGGGGGITAWRQATDDLERGLGRGLDLSWHARSWQQGLPWLRMREDLAAGRIPLVAWTELDVSGVVDGSSDERVDRLAAAVAAQDKPVLLAPLPPESGDADAYVEAFRRLRDRFLAAEADNAAFVWCPGAEAFVSGAAERWYPGDEAVDWVCAVGSGDGPPDEQFSAFLGWAERVDAPALLVAEPGADEAAYIEALHALLDRGWTAGGGVDALVWLDADGTSAHDALRRLARDESLRPPRRAPGPLTVARGALLGAHAKDSPTYTPEEAERATTELESDLGRPLDIAHAFYPWDRSFPTVFERESLAQGRIPMISWNGTDVAEIVAGRHDALIRERADALAALGEPVLLRWFWEMDGRRKAEWARDPEAYVAAWRHIRTLFDERGADQVAWVWCPNAMGFETGEAPRWYPGDDSVDWLCADGYNLSGAQPGAASRGLYDLFRDFYAWADERGKPIMIGEVGAVERGPGQKAAWHTAAGDDLQTWLPNVQAYVYFDAVDYGAGWDWQLDSSPSSLRAFTDLAADPYLNPRPRRHRHPDVFDARVRR